MPWDIVGHCGAVAALRAALVSGQVGHAYMFAGPQGIGKTRLASILAGALLCEQPASKAPCLTCRGCRRVQSGNHPDLHWVTPAGSSMRIEQVRALQAQIKLRPYEGRHKVCVLDDADMLTEQAQNSMLKSLEEPPGSGVFILVAHRPAALLPTIHSRCQVFRLRPVPEPMVAELVRARLNVSPGEAALLAALSEGRPGYALGLDPQTTLAQRDRAIAWCTSLRQEGLKAVWTVAGELEGEADLQDWLNIMAVWFRDVWHASLDRALHVANVDKSSLLEREAHAWGSAAHNAVVAISEARRQLARNANKRLVLDVMLTRIQRGLPSHDKGSRSSFQERGENILFQPQ